MLLIVLSVVVALVVLVVGGLSLFVGNKGHDE
jgi:uncharacterized protein YneF (UPF0154 family)